MGRAGLSIIDATGQDVGHAIDLLMAHVSGRVQWMLPLLQLPAEDVTG